jgi:aldose 1-epimerase
MSDSESRSVANPLGPGGPEWRITAGGYEPVITAVGAYLRTLTFNGRDLVVPFDADQLRPFYRGATIAPWPNRIRDGRYTFDGTTYQVPINEVERNTALHGLVHWVRWDLVEASESRLVLGHSLVPQDGYPFALRLVAEFTVTPAGFGAVLRTTNTGTSDAPYACCPHPYLVAGPGPLDSWYLSLPTRTRLEVDDRLLPTVRRAVSEVDCDFTEPARIGSRAIDHAFTDVDRDSHGRAAVRVWSDETASSGVELSWGPWGTWLQIHTADRPEPEHHRAGLAVEPMGCAPDGFNAPEGAPRLPAGETAVAEWTIAALG